jgi:hypothetical protein
LHKIPDWFLNWSGEICVIVASGPSAKDYNYEEFKDQAKWIVTNTSYQLAPWADVLLAADGHWWQIHKGVPEFAGLKVTLDHNIAHQFNIPKLSLTKQFKYITVDKPGIVGMGGHSGFYALNLAIQFGAKRIILSGFDLTLKNGLHWHGSHPKALNNPIEFRVLKWRKDLDGQLENLKTLGVEVINASKNSALTAYPKMPLKEALDRWRN